MQGESYEGSALGAVHIFDSAAAVMGELQVASSHAGSVKLQVTLEAAVQKSLESLESLRWSVE